MSRTGSWVVWLIAVVFLFVFDPMARGADGPVIRIEPSANLQAALDEAPPGTVCVLSAGRHHGPVIIAHQLTLRGEPGARLVGTGVGSVLTITGRHVRVESLEVERSGRNFSTDDAGVLVLGDDAHIQGLSLRENLHGIYVRRAKRVHLISNEVAGLAATNKDLAAAMEQEAHLGDGMHHNPPGAQALMGNGLHLFNAHGAVVQGNHIHHARDGIYVAHTSDAVFRGNRIHDSRYGIHYMYSSQNVIEGNTLWRNVAGPALMFSRDLTVADNILRDHGGFRAYGLLLQNIETSQIHDNQILGNRVGVRLQNSNANRFVGNRIGGNLSGMTINSSSRDNAFTRNVYGFNLHQVELTGPVPPTDWSVDGVGNWWHGAMPLDLTGDGISEWPHHEVDLMGPRREQFPPVQLLIGSPGIRALEWALKRAPVPRLRHVTDPHPLTRRLSHD